MKHAKIIFPTIVSLLLVSGMVAFGLNAFEPKTHTAAVKAVRPVKTMTLTPLKDNISRSFPGVVKAAKDVRLAFRVSGPIIEFDVDTGTYLKKGDVIARIDPRDYKVRINRIKAGIREASAGLKAMQAGARNEDLSMLKSKLAADNAQLEEARRTFERYANLLKDKAVSKAAYDRAKTAFDMAGAKVAATKQEIKKATKGARSEEIEAVTAKIAGLKAGLQAARNALKDTVLVMPFNGYVSGKYAQAFETVKAGMPVLSCIDISRLEITVGIPEDFYTRQADFEHFTCTLDAFAGTTLDATLKEIGEKPDGIGQTYPLTAVIQTRDKIDIKPGMAATLHIAMTQPGEQAVLIPVEAVFSDTGNSSCVWVIKSNTRAVHQTRVQTGRLTENKIEIRQGLLPGQMIATAGVHSLKEGQIVRPVSD